MNIIRLNNYVLPPIAQILKKHEYFGKYGKIHKVVINPSTAYAGQQVSGFLVSRLLCIVDFRNELSHTMLAALNAIVDCLL